MGRKKASELPPEYEIEPHKGMAGKSVVLDARVEEIAAYARRELLDHSVMVAFAKRWDCSPRYVYMVVAEYRKRMGAMIAGSLSADDLYNYGLAGLIQSMEMAAVNNDVAELRKSGNALAGLALKAKEFSQGILIRHQVEEAKAQSTDGRGLADRWRVVEAEVVEDTGQ